MTEQIGAAEATQGEAEQQAQGATTQAQGADDQQQAQGAAEGTEGESTEALRSKITQLLGEKKALQAEKREREEAEKQKAKDELPELDRLKADNTELREANTKLVAQLQKQSLEMAASQAATRLGFREPADAIRYVDQDAVTFSDDGAPTNVDELIKKAAEARPYLLAVTDFGGGQRGTSPAAGPTDMNAIIRKAAGKQ